MLTVIVFIVTGMMGAGFAALVMHQKKTRVRERALAVISGSAAVKPQEGDKKENAEASGQTMSTSTDIAKKLKRAARNEKKGNNPNSTASLLMQAGMKMTPLVFWGVSSTVASIASSIIWSMNLSPIIASLLTFTVYMGAPRFFLRFKAARRQKAFLEDFADALEAMIRLIKAGMPVSEAIAMVGREFSGPMGDEMSRVYDAQKLGQPLQEAIRGMVPRIPLPEVQMFAAAIAIQAQTGSSLSEVLGNLSGVIRARARLKRKVQALSSEAKASASIIGCLPIMVSLALWGVNPDYIELLFTHPTGKMLSTGAIIWMSLGVLAMRQMINFKV